MRLMIGLLLALGLLATGAAVASRTGNDASEDQPIEVSAEDRLYRLTSPDSPADCVVEKGAQSGPGMVALTVPADCDLVMPGLSAAHFWKEAGEGTIAFTLDGGEDVALFSVGDGVAYESIQPRRPLMALALAD